MKMNETVIHIVEDDPSMIEAVCYYLASEGLKTKSYGNAEEFLADYVPTNNGCIVLDVKMPGLSGIELFEEIINKNIDLPVIFFSGHGTLPMAVSMLKKGAFHFLEKPLRPDLFIQVIKDALKENHRKHSALHTKDQLEREYATLSEREVQVLTLILKGLTNKIIAERKGLSERTIENYRANLYRKLGVHNVEELKLVLDLLKQ